ncbi:MAG: hypothetical protein ACI936_000011 [Paraglaciecola sp.]|jgi:uncharacterized protein (TIGR02922 family)
MGAKFVFNPAKIISSQASMVVTVIYYDDVSLELKHAVKTFDYGHGGRVVLPNEYRLGKSIVAICKGDVQIINKLGDRILPAEKAG